MNKPVIFPIPIATLLTGGTAVSSVILAHEQFLRDSPFDELRTATQKLGTTVNNLQTQINMHLISTPLHQDERPGSVEVHVTPQLPPLQSSGNESFPKERSENAGIEQEQQIVKDNNTGKPKLLDVKGTPLTGISFVIDVSEVKSEIEETLKGGDSITLPMGNVDEVILSAKIKASSWEISLKPTTGDQLDFTISGQNVLVNDVDFGYKKLRGQAFYHANEEIVKGTIPAEAFVGAMLGI